MATFKALVRPHQLRRDGTYPLMIRVTHRRETQYVNTNIYCTKNDLTKSFKLKNRQHLDAADALIARFRRVCDTLSTQLDTMTVKELALKLTQPQEAAWSLDFIAYTREYAAKIEAQGKLATASMYRTAINNFCAFLGR